MSVQAIEDEEEKSFIAQPEDVQKLFAQKYGGAVKTEEGDEGTKPNEEEGEESGIVDAERTDVELPPLLDEETQKEKETLLEEGFGSWSRGHYMLFTKACAKFGRENYSKIAAAVGKSEDEIKLYASAFWGDQGKQRISEVCS